MVFPTYFLQGLQTELLMMESVKCAHSLKETSLDNILHALVEIQSYLFDAHSLIFWYLLQRLAYYTGLGTLDYGNNTPFATMSTLAGNDCIDFTR